MTILPLFEVSGCHRKSRPAKKCLPPFPELPRELMLFAQEVCRDPCMQLGERQEVWGDINEEYHIR